MQRDAIDLLFQRPSHNPSFFQVRAAAWEDDVLDFCVPVNTWFPPPAMLDAVSANLGDILKYYPDDAGVHQSVLAELTDIPASCIVPANGSTEIITRLCHRLPGPLVTPVPTFGRWTDLPLERGTPTRFLQRGARHGFHVGVDEMLRQARSEPASTLVVCNPDNPTGVALSLCAIEHLARELRDAALVVIDESFIDFSDVGSAAELATKAENVVVVKSMGKSLGWHGLRLGYAVANPRLAAELRHELPFWNVNGLASFVLKQLPRYRKELRSSHEAVKRDRGSMARRLRSIPKLRVHASQANFLFCELPPDADGERLRTRLLAEHRILVRECGNKLGGTSAQWRLAVQRAPAVDRLADALEDCLA